MSITGSNNPFACNPVVFANANSIVSLGTITRDGNEFTFSVGFVWKINGVTYQNTSPVVITIAEASEGFNRIDNALLNTSNSIELQQGLESDTIALRPVAPETNIILTSWNISGTTIGDAEASILGSQFKKKSESLGYGDPSLTGENAVIQLRPEGNSRYALGNAGLISIDGFGLSLITGNPSAEVPYDGKDLFIENTGTTPFTLNHDGSGSANIKFFFTDETDLIVPVGGKLWLKYGNPYCQLFFKSFTKYKIYRALLTQSGASAPTVVVLENTIGSIVWTRVGPGVYSANLRAAFPVNKTFCSATFSNKDAAGGGKSIGISRNSDNTVLLRTADSLIGSSSVDGLMLEPTSIEILVY